MTRSRNHSGIPSISSGTNPCRMRGEPSTRKLIPAYKPNLVNRIRIKQMKQEEVKVVVGDGGLGEVMGDQAAMAGDRR